MVVPPLFAQAVFEYVGLANRAPMFDSIREAAEAFFRGLKDIDQQTWMLIGGILLVTMVLTRRSR